jgi:hypothetical protein
MRVLRGMNIYCLEEVSFFGSVCPEHQGVCDLTNLPGLIFYELGPFLN